ncbi:atherin-like [Penaeus monodon]|uniref:atherin-like n=1 Tax=Penaeus monodon TaxID=6687 RepID=UPI0018A735A3|nr:atherin-like [Penaeus monodon]
MNKKSKSRSGTQMAFKIMTALPRAGPAPSPPPPIRPTFAGARAGVLRPYGRPSPGMARGTVSYTLADNRSPQPQLLTAAAPHSSSSLQPQLPTAAAPYSLSSPQPQLPTASAPHSRNSPQPQPSIAPQPQPHSPRKAPGSSTITFQQASLTNNERTRTKYKPTSRKNDSKTETSGPTSAILTNN